MMTDSTTVLSQADLIDGLRRFQDDFNKDFALRDVFHSLRIPKKDYKTIVEAKCTVEKNDRLLFYYIYIAKDVRPLLMALKESYYWIYEKILSSANDKWISDYRRAIQDIPNNHNFNVHRVEYLWTIQQELKTLKRGNYLILFGKLGFGKKWLAADACHDYGVIHQMDFKIYWLNASKCINYDLILDKLHLLKVLLQADDYDIKYNAYSGNSKNEAIHVKSHLRKVLERPEYKNCLIVLTDVQDDKVVKAFDLNCKMLITTRHMGKLESAIDLKKRKIIEINKGLTPNESHELFKKAFWMEELTSELPQIMLPFIEEVYQKISGHPFITSLIVKTFQHKEKDIQLQKRCEDWILNLDKYTFFDEYQQIKMPIEESLKFLNDKQLRAYSKMVVFSDNVDVPVDVLSKLWQTQRTETECIIDKLHKYSLIEKQCNFETCSLHYVHYKYLKDEVSESDQIEYHRQLIEEYEIDKIYNNRTDLELNFPNDNYFHFFIGYHLLGAKRLDLFDLYLDFGFLEEKIRIANLPNTLGDLNKFKDEIVRGDKRREKFLEQLKEFLPPIEQLIFKSDDMTILQCALNHEGMIKDEAKKQIERYSDRVWMDDVNHIENANQMFVLAANSQPRLVRFARLDSPDDNVICLVSLQDNNILLHDVATNYTDGPILYKNDLPHSAITDIQIFRNQAFLVLNESGKLSVYYLKWNATRRPSAPTKLGTSEALHERQPFVLDCPNDRYTCFNVIEQHVVSDTDLIVGTKKGVIKFFKWLPRMNKFEDNKKDIKTDFHDLYRMAHINDYVMLMNNLGDAKFVDLINTSTLMLTVQWQKQESPVSLHQGTCQHMKCPITISVSEEKVIQIIHEQKRSFSEYNVIKIELEEIFSVESQDNRILSSAISKDSEYLILGSSQGIWVIDRHKKKVICRRNISEQVISLDVYRYPDEMLYIFLSVFKDAGQMVSLHGFNANHAELSRTKTCFLVGENLFDVKKFGDEFSLITVDAKGNIHFRTSADDFQESYRTEKFTYQVKRICHANSNAVIAGCTNGSVYSIDEMNNINLLTQLTGEITYMENIDNNIIISCNSCYQLLGMNENLIKGKATKAFRYKENVLLVVKKNCTIEFLDIAKRKVITEMKIASDTTCMAQAYNNTLLAVATSKRNVYLLKISEDTGEHVMCIDNQIEEEITSVAISADNSILAVGCFSGNIELYDIQELVPIFVFESHRAPITNLHFSPWLENEGPIILASLADSVNFWNVTHVINNKLGDMKRNSKETTKSRLSQRFKASLIISPTLPMEKSVRNSSLQENNWSNKTGPFNKRELLSCIKFLGKNAKKLVFDETFTRFITIDSEGNIYHLRLIDQIMAVEDIDRGQTIEIQ